MEDEVAKIRAKYERGSLMVVEHDHLLKPPLVQQDLIPYLEFLSEQGWIATTGSFEGFTVEIELQRTLTDKQVSYSKQEFQFGGYSVIQKEFLKELKQPMLKYGWKEFACSTLLGLSVVPGGVALVILWIKVLPKLPASL